MDKGTLASDTSYYRMAIKYYNASLQVARQQHLDDREIVAFINLSNAYNVFGKKTGNKYYLDISLAYSLKSLDLAEEKHELRLKAISLTNLGEIMESYENTEKAVEYYQQALDQYQTLEEYSWMVYVNNLLGKVYEKDGRYDKAIEHLRQSISISEKQRFKNGLQDSYNLLANIYSAKKDHAAALDYYKKSNAFKDSLTQQKNLIALAGLQLEFDSEQKDHKIALLSKDQLLKEQAIGIQHVYRNFLIGGCIALFILLVFVYLRYREKQKTALEILRAKEAAEKAKELQEQFLTNTSHEIRTPMNGIIGMTQHLLGSHLSADQRQYISVINESANNLMVIINDLLDMSKIKAGKMSFEAKPFSIREMVRSISVLLESKTKEKDIALCTNIDPQIPELVTGDAVRIQQVLLNLAGNAVKFTEEGEVNLRVELLQKDDEKFQILFVVKDSGIGIPAEQLENIFENFTQVDGKTTRKQGGTGLGLAISKQLVRQMGGNISVNSIEGSGSVFKVELFLGIHHSEQNPITVIAETKQPSTANPLAGLTILVVDDNKINRQVASLSLEKWGVHVLLAEGGQEAVDQLARNKNIDIVLMDVLMPGMDGFETTRYIREQMNRDAQELPIVAMTASAIHGERDKCLAAGMNDYISKPFNPISLFDLLSRHVNTDMRQRERPATNFTHLQAKADGNHEFLVDIMETYITEMPEYLVELNYQVIQEDLRNIRAQAHKMKSPAALFGANELKEHLQYIELHIEEGITPQIRKKLELANDLCRRTIDETTEALKQVSKLVK
jgi:signal transduction histidine kinase/CheY-like chemotaxis protein